MFGFNRAIVTKVLPDRHGVLVTFRNGVSVGNGQGSGDNQSFVRVLERRAHSYGGSTVSLPEEGEVGLVAEVEPGLLVWLGSLPWEETNQMDPRPGLEAWRHPSGVETVVTEDGDCQFSHPSGMVLTVSAFGSEVPRMQGSTPLAQRYAAGGDAPHVVLRHPSGFVAHLDPAGNLKVDSPAALEGNFMESVLLTTKSTLTATAVGDASIHTESNLAASAGGNIDATAGGHLNGTGATAKLTATRVEIDSPITKVSGILQVQGPVLANGGMGIGDEELDPAGALPGNLHVQGWIKSDTDLISVNRHFNEHVHGGVQPGSSSTGAPV